VKREKMKDVITFYDESGPISEEAWNKLMRKNPSQEIEIKFLPCPPLKDTITEFIENMENYWNNFLSPNNNDGCMDE
jgi:archaellum component FlaD/FlaE